MVLEPFSELAHIGEALLAMRAAIDLVASHGANRVTIHAAAGVQILAAGRILARSAGVRIEPTWWPDRTGCDIVISTGRAPTDA